MASSNLPWTRAFLASVMSAPADASGAFELVSNFARISATSLGPLTEAGALAGICPLVAGAAALGTSGVTGTSGMDTDLVGRSGATALPAGFGPVTIGSQPFAV